LVGKFFNLFQSFFFEVEPRKCLRFDLKKYLIIFTSKDEKSLVNVCEKVISYHPIHECTCSHYFLLVIIPSKGIPHSFLNKTKEWFKSVETVDIDDELEKLRKQMQNFTSSMVDFDTSPTNV